MSKPRMILVSSGTGLKVTWSSSYITNLPDSSFACIDSAGRHYPHHNTNGDLDLPHLRAALSRIGDASNVQCGRRHLEAHARSAGVGERSDKPPAITGTVSIVVKPPATDQ